VCLWTKTASNEAVQVNVGKQFKEFLEYDQACGFLTHVCIPLRPFCLIACGAASCQGSCVVHELCLSMVSALCVGRFLGN